MVADEFGAAPSSVPAGGKLASSSGSRTQTCTKNHTHPPQCHRSCPGADRRTDPGSARNNQHKCSSHAATPASARTQDKVQNPQPAQERQEPSPPAGHLPFTFGLGATPAAPPPRPSAAGATPAPLKGTRGPPRGCHLSRGVSTLPTRVDSSPARNESSALTPSPLFQPLSPRGPSFCLRDLANSCSSFRTHPRGPRFHKASPSKPGHSLHGAAMALCPLLLRLPFKMSLPPTDLDC